MKNSDKKNSGKNKRDWVDISLKAMSPIVAGLLIAWAGFVGDYTLSSVADKQQSARLITELQIRREQAESDLRKDVFDQALQAFLLKAPEQEFSLFSMSKQLLRLELLSLNFGDSLSLSPLFTEFREDLKNLKPKEDEIPYFEESKGELRKRLYSLARRVASAQVSSLEQHGASKTINIPLKGYRTPLTPPCAELIYPNGFAWPDWDLHRSFGITNDKGEFSLDERGSFDFIQDPELLPFFVEASQEARKIPLGGVDRYLEVSVTDVDHCGKSAKVTVILYKQADKKPAAAAQTDTQATIPEDEKLLAKDDFLSDLSTRANQGLEEEVKRSFNLDYFNFPMVDNTRLQNNHRFAIVLDEFDLKSASPHIELIGIVFPSEYASLRDRTGMKEARKLLQDALSDNETK